MKHTMPPRLELKTQAKRRMGQALGACSALGAAVAIVELLADAFLQRAGGAFPLYYWDTASHAIQTSVSLSAQGLYAALRLDEVGVGLSVAISPATLLTFVLVHLCVGAVAAPLRLGCLDHLWAAEQGTPRPFRGVFGWYTDLRRAGRAAALELILGCVQLVLLGLFCIPAAAALVGSGGSLTGFTAAAWLLLLAQAAVWCVMTQLAPARYLLARGGGVGAALRDSQTILRSRRGQYLVFRLSFWFWDLLNNLSRGILYLYVFPYEGLANMGWIRAAESLNAEC
ncbi:MAG: hypothetical protein ACI4ML_02590 [Aristaeellaceae bacterium]